METHQDQLQLSPLKNRRWRLELDELPGSPRFPRRSDSPGQDSASDSSSSPAALPRARPAHLPYGPANPAHTATPTTPCHSDDASTDGGTTSRRSLFGRVRERLPGSGSSEGGGSQREELGSNSPSLKSPRSPRSPRRFAFPGSPKLAPKTTDTTYRSSSGSQYSVAARDASLLGRISHRAHKRAHRVLKPHQVVVELEELRTGVTSGAQGMEWQETARWIRFEEDVETGSKQWGRPHVSALSFHSLVDLRRGLERGSILLGVRGDSFPELVDSIVDSLLGSGQLPLEAVQQTVQALYQKHHHQYESNIWESFKDGTLHQLGDQLRQRLRNSSAQHLSSVGEKGNEEGGGEAPSTGHAPSRDHEDSQMKRVMFKIASSSSVLDPVSGNGTSAASTDTAIELDESIDGKCEAPPRPILKHVHPMASAASFQEEPLRLNKSALSLMEMLPGEAETLTVLVGGVTFLQAPLVAFVRLSHSHRFGELTELPFPVRFIFLLLGPVGGEVDYHEVGRAMATLMSDKCFHEVAYTAMTRDDLLDGIDVFLEDSIVLPPGDWDADLLLPIMHQRNEARRRRESKQAEAETRRLFAVDPIRCTRRPCGGVWHDLKVLVRRYPSDLRDALHLQCLLTILFVFISCLGPAIAFGGLMEEVTGNLIGETETLVATGLSGVVYGALGVQPLAILAFTSPLLLFEEIVFEFSTEVLQLPYLEWRAAVSLWMALMLLVLALTESTFLVHYFSRFSEEVFTGVVCTVFTYEASKNLYKIFERNPLCPFNEACGFYGNYSNNCVYLNYSLNYSSSALLFSGNASNATSCDLIPRGFRVCNQPNTALWSLVLCLGTFLIAFLLRKLRRGKLLGKGLRRLVSDFGMLTAIGVMVTVAYLMKCLVTVETLELQGGLRPSSPQRNWVINVFNQEVWQAFFALVPASLLAMLIFIENQLTLLLVNKAEHKLAKGVGYHWDLLIVAGLAAVCGVLGMPWVCAASVRSMQHLQALSVYSHRNAPGEKPKLVGVYEQRVTNIAVHLMIFFSPFAAYILRQIPFAVVLGVFFYLAYASVSSIQLKTRIKLLFMHPKHYPDLFYVRKVRMLKMHSYTVLQLVLVLILFGVKLSPGAMVYPLIIVLLIPLRFFLGKTLFSEREIEALDSEEDFPEDEDEGELLEYQETHVPY